MSAARPVKILNQIDNSHSNAYSTQWNEASEKLRDLSCSIEEQFDYLADEAGLDWIEDVLLGGKGNGR